ncbi:hypothetical protein [Pontibacter chitinilyticus]|uniref:hypothetical protein n=1 Tax=Pontibacter chitinilyticus TaxID=2674989 RepID=UPI00321ACD6F
MASNQIFVNGDATIAAGDPDFEKKADINHFKWYHLPLPLELQYNNLLASVVSLDSDYINGDHGVAIPNYYNKNFCLALSRECVPAVIERASDGENGGQPTLNACQVNLGFEGAGYLQRPMFHYIRLQNPPDQASSNLPADFFKLDLKSLTVGTLIWLYYYERMGIFKILGALMDDYNYTGKYPISSKIGWNGTNDVFVNKYSSLMEGVCLLYRQGLSSNLRDRICSYQRVLGVTIENNMNIVTEKNEGFMKSFNKLIGYMLEFYKAKQLAVAIQSAGNNGRSSVATQTSIRDTIIEMNQHFEAMEYGRNMINTYTGIATVYITICLIQLIRNEIGIPTQYEKPEEFIPAAYDILVLKKSVTSTNANRFTIYDNCASYGYRLLTDIQLLNTTLIQPVAVGSVLDVWLNDVEGLVEGYNNAYKSVEEPVGAIAH